MSRNFFRKMKAPFRMPMHAVLATLLMTDLSCSNRSAPSGGASATMSVPPLQVNFTDSHLLTTATEAEIYPDFTLSDPELVPEPLIFAYHRQDAMNSASDPGDPAAHRRHLALRGNALAESQGLGLGSGTSLMSRNELWAISRQSAASELPDPGLYLFKSSDKGQTWKLFSALRPPTREAEFVSFTMDAKGNGKIVVHQDDDTDAAPRGQYAYATTDGGVTWSGPAFTADDLVSAEVPLTPTLQEVLTTLDNGTDTTIPVEPAGPSGRRGRGPGFPGGRGPNGPGRRGG